MAVESFAWSQPQPKIVQYKKKRYALRLEHVYWQQLEVLARRRQWRLGRLIAELDALHDGANLSSFIRGFCMVEAERDASRFRLMSGSFDLLDILRGCPASAILLNQDRLIIDVNQALLDWAGVSGVFRQKPFEMIFSPRMVRPLDETFELMKSGQLKRTQIQVVFNGRTVMATLTGLSVGNIFYCLVWLLPSQQMRLR